MYDIWGSDSRFMGQNDPIGGRSGRVTEYGVQQMENTGIHFLQDTPVYFVLLDCTAGCSFHLSWYCFGALLLASR